MSVANETVYTKYNFFYVQQKAHNFAAKFATLFLCLFWILVIILLIYTSWSREYCFWTAFWCTFGKGKHGPCILHQGPYYCRRRHFYIACRVLACYHIFSYVFLTVWRSHPWSKVVGTAYVRALLEYATRLPRAVLGRPYVAAEKAVQPPCWTMRTCGFCDHIVSTTVQLPCSVGTQKCCGAVISCNASKENVKVDHHVTPGSKLWPIGLSAG